MHLMPTGLRGVKPEDDFFDRRFFDFFIVRFFQRTRKCGKKLTVLHQDGLIAAGERFESFGSPHRATTGCPGHLASPSQVGMLTTTGEQFLML
jgi:hypothetical protein